MDIHIRQEHAEDFSTVCSLVKDAFANVEQSEGDEQNVVERLRQSEGFVPGLSLVAECDGKIVGHILFTIIKIGMEDSLILAPVSVLPAYQRMGIGSLLIKKGHQIAKELGFSSAVLVGHPTYYPRFGYRRASKWGIQLSIPAPDECFMAVELVPGSLDSAGGNVIVLPPAFGL
ncbi:MAG: N-acetyltransferase [Eubacteriales bacterium]